MIPGEYRLAGGTITINEGRPTLRLDVLNTGDRPIQVGSPFHFAEVNSALSFDRRAARGFRLDIPAGTAVRFEPGDSPPVHPVALADAPRAVAGLLSAHALAATDPRAIEMLTRAARTEGRVCHTHQRPQPSTGAREDV